MTLDEQRRMALLEATLRAVRRLNELAKTDPQSVPMEDAMEGRLRREWARISRQIDALVPP